MTDLRTALESVRRQLHAANRPVLREGLRIKLRDEIDAALAQSETGPENSREEMSPKTDGTLDCCTTATATPAPTRNTCPACHAAAGDDCGLAMSVCDWQDKEEALRQATPAPTGEATEVPPINLNRITLDAASVGMTLKTDDETWAEIQRLPAPTKCPRCNGSGYLVWFGKSTDQFSAPCPECTAPEVKP